MAEKNTNIEYIFANLKYARQKLSLTQGEAAHGSGLEQRDISLMENGRAKFIATSYIIFLQSQGVDLNTIFSDKLQVTVIDPNEIDEEGVELSPDMKAFEKRLRRSIKEDYDQQIEGVVIESLGIHEKINKVEQDLSRKIHDLNGKVSKGQLQS